MTNRQGKKIKVAFLEGSAMIGGAEANVLNLIEKMDVNKFETLVICPCEGPFTARIKEIGGRVSIVRRLPLIATSVFIKGKKVTNPFAILYDFISFVPSFLILAKFLKHEQVDVLHTNSMLAHFYGAIAARLVGVQCIWHVQDIVDPHQAFATLRKLINWAGRWLPHKIVVVSEAVGKMFTGNTARKVRVVYNGSDISRYNPANSGEGVRKEFGITYQEAVIGIVGRIVHWKGHKEFLLAARGVYQEIPNTKFLIVGDSAFGSKEYLEEVKNLAQRLGLGKVAVFTGFRNDVPELIAAMDICVHASNLPDPCPLVVFDYMAAGKPIVATSGGGVPEIIEDGITGTLVPMKDPAALEKGIIEMLTVPEKREKLGRAGRKRVEELFTVDDFVKNMSYQYQELALGAKSDFKIYYT
jgi:glycosyltransferase involved in cell wall biosynthesis